MLNPQSHASDAVADLSANDLESRRSGRVEELQSQIERLMTRMRIAVVFGGDKSTEGAVINPTSNPRSWKSYEAVAVDISDGLRRLGFRHVEILPEDMQLGDRMRRSGIHMAWVNSGGVQGYNPMAHAAAMLEMIGIPYVGHDPLTAGMADNKHVFKRELTALGIPTAPFVISHYGSGPFQADTHRRFYDAFGDYEGPFIVKPVTGRASLNVNVVEHRSKLTQVVGRVRQLTENHVLVERYLPGREYCVAVSGLVTAVQGCLTRNNEPFVFSAVERVLEPDERIFTSMDIRPITNERVRLLDPVEDAAALSQLGKLARDVFGELNFEALVRLDLRADSDGNLMVLEANPKPDLKYPDGERISLVCAGLDACGMSYDDLIFSLIADRIDLLFSQRRHAATQLKSLLETS